MDLAPQPAPLTLPDSALDFVLTSQFVVAWAGEGGEAPRLGWWRSFMVHEDGGLALFADLTPRTHRWVAFQGAREAARRADAAMRRKNHDADRLHSLFHFGYEIDERLDERLLDHKRGGRDPFDALPDLREPCASRWNPVDFADWVSGHGTENHVAAPAGRRLVGPPPTDLEGRVRRLVAALHPIPPTYPMPHFKTG